MAEGSDKDRPVTEETFNLRMKVLEQRLTLKLIAGLVAVQALGHITLPSSVTVPAALAIVGKVLFSLR